MITVVNPVTALPDIHWNSVNDPRITLTASINIPIKVNFFLIFSYITLLVTAEFTKVIVTVIEVDFYLRVRIVFFKLFQSDVFTNTCFQTCFHAHIDDAVHLAVQHVTWSTITGNAVHHHATQIFVVIKDGAGVAAQAQAQPVMPQGLVVAQQERRSLRLEQEHIQIAIVVDISEGHRTAVTIPQPLPAVNIGPGPVVEIDAVLTLWRTVHGQGIAERAVSDQRVRVHLATVRLGHRPTSASAMSEPPE